MDWRAIRAFVLFFGGLAVFIAEVPLKFAMPDPWIAFPAGVGMMIGFALLLNL